MKGETKLSGLTEPPLGAPAPAPANMSTSTKEKELPELGSSKKSDDTYRLFVVSL
jgi:hypothetical protein